MNKGFTLIELLIAVAIIGVLSAVAYPMYANHAISAKRSDGFTSLSYEALVFERCKSENSTYSSCAVSSSTSKNGYYEISSAIAADGLSYTLTATPVAGKSQAQDTTCASLTLTSDGRRGSTGTTANPASCWSK